MNSRGFLLFDCLVGIGVFLLVLSGVSFSLRSLSLNHKNTVQFQLYLYDAINIFERIRSSETHPISFSHSNVIISKYDKNTYKYDYILSPTHSIVLLRRFGTNN